MRLATAATTEQRDIASETLGNTNLLPLPITSRPQSLTSFLDDLLAEQQSLTAVESFARWHKNDHVGHQQATYYRSLLPATAPGPDEQYAFEVDLDACSGCKACVTACHSLNGLDESESWRSVGLLIGGTPGTPYQQHVTTACHHCVDPGCLIGCPTNAYEKDPTTGIVRHLDDQCFGCQYCVLMCPYEVPQYSAKRGIVRKCDMCSQRLSQGEAPACVQACPHQAIKIQIVKTTQIPLGSAGQTVSVGMNLVPSAPSSSITTPTTVYYSKRVLPEHVRAAHAGHEDPAHGHPPLTVMLVLTQASVGALVMLQLLLQLMPGSVALQLGMSVVAWAYCVVGLLASTLHLGRPWLAYRAVLGIRHSWLSREVVALGLYFGLLSGTAGVAGLTWLAWWQPSTLLFGLTCLTVTIGLLGVACSALVYIVTQRPLWNATAVSLRFALTTIKLGFVTAIFMMLLSAESKSENWTIQLGLGLVITQLIAVIFEYREARQDRPDRRPFLQIRAGFYAGQLRAWSVTRVLTAVLGTGLCLMTTLFSGDPSTSHFALGCSALVAGLLLLISELCERHLFFVAHAAPSMPRGMP